MLAVPFLLLASQGADARPPEHRLGAWIRVGWNDELNSPRAWSPLAMENKATVLQPKQGALKLVLGITPAGWPYQYQWSGVSRDATVDVARFPVVSARVKDVRGYAHLDIDVLDASGKAVKTVRTVALNADGITSVDLGQTLDPATYSLRFIPCSWRSCSRRSNSSSGRLMANLRAVIPASYRSRTRMAGQEPHAI